MGRAPLSDTDGAVGRLLVGRWREMTAEERVAQIDALCADVERLARVGIDRASPGLSPQAVRHELARRRYGRELADAAYGSALGPR